MTVSHLESRSNQRFGGVPPVWAGLLLAVPALFLFAPILGARTDALQLWSFFHVLGVLASPWILRWYMDVKLGFVPALVILWPVGILFSDAAQGVPLASTFAELLIAASYLIPVVAFPWLVHGQPERFVPVGLATMVGSAAFALPHFVGTDLLILWKFALGGPLAFCVALALSRSKYVGSLQVPVVLGAMSLLSFALGARSLGGSFAIGALLMMAMSVRRGAKPALAFQLVLGLLAAFVSVYGYGIAASQGWLGEAQRVRYDRIEAASSGLVDSGRPQQPVSWMLVRERPILGSGSNPVLTPQERIEAVKILFDRGVSLSDYVNERVFADEFQAHSILLDVWIRAGILGAIGAAGVPIAAAVIVARTYRNRLPTQFLPFLACAMPTIAWDLYYSPVSPLSGALLGLTLSVVGLARIAVPVSAQTSG